MANVTTPDAAEEMKTVTLADGTEIAFERTGSGSPLVLVAGGLPMITRDGYQAGVRSAFAEHCTVYAMDRRGHSEEREPVNRLDYE